MGKKVSLKTLSVEIKKGTKVSIEYDFKVNEYTIPGSEPMMFNAGESVVGAPEIISVERSIHLGLPIAKQSNIPVFPIIFYPEDDQGKKDNTQNTKFFTIGVTTGSILYCSYYKVTLKNPSDKTLVIHSVSFTSNVFSIELEIPPGKLLGLPNLIPSFNTFKREATLTGGTLGEITGYTFSIPPSHNFVIHFYAFDNKAETTQTIFGMRKR
jgi:hypothetical protein